MSSAFILESRNKTFTACSDLRISRALNDGLDKSRRSSQQLPRPYVLADVTYDERYMQCPVDLFLLFFIFLYSFCPLPCPCSSCHDIRAQPREDGKLPYKIQNVSSDPQERQDGANLRSLVHLLHFHAHETGLGTARAGGVVPALLVKGFAALVQRLDDMLAFGIVVVAPRQAV